MTDHVYQFGTIAELRKRYETHSSEAEIAAERAQRLLGAARAHAARARDAALFLDIADPEWKAECETPIVARTLRLKAWREMLDFLEAHPEIGIGNYESLTIEQPNGDRATPEFLESIEHLGIKVEHGKQHVTAELWFGNRDVKLTAYAKVELPPEIAPVADPDAIDEHQALEAAADADQAAGAAIDAAVEATGHLPGCEPLPEDEADPADEPLPDEEKFHLGDIVTVVKPGQLAELEKSPGRVVEVVVEAEVRFGVEFPGDGEPYILYLAAEQLQRVVVVEDCMAGQPA